jgi:hypothetical protein
MRVERSTSNSVGGVGESGARAAGTRPVRLDEHLADARLPRTQDGVDEQWLAALDPYLRMSRVGEIVIE